MRRWNLRSFITATFLACLVTFAFNATALAAAKNGLKVGAAKVKITPTTPIPLSGFGGRNDPFKGVHDDLYARSIVFSDGVNKAATITCELVGLSNQVWDEVSSRIEKEIGIKKDFILLSCVHTHSGPTTNVYNDGNTPEVAAYMEELKSKLVAVVKEANANLVDAKIGAGKGECLMNMSRRAQDGKGHVTLGLNPYAPCDHEVGVIRIDDKSDKHIALLVNWPCHAVVIGPRNYQVTSDWPGSASKFIETGLGGNLIAPIAVGASGDINPLYGPHVDFENNNSYAFGKDAIGEDLANVSMDVMKNIKTSSAGTISAVQRVISIEAKPKENTKSLQPDREDDGKLKVRLSVIKIGDIVFTGVSGEVFNQISVQMRKKSPFKNTFMITHCNGSSGYLVTEDAYPTATQKGYEDKFHPKGGYEPGSTRAKTGAEKAIIDNLVDMIKTL
jgi:neutral ceramidase